MRLLLILGYLLIVDFSVASDSLNIFLLGEKAFEEGDYDVAALEFEKVAYIYSDDNNIRTQALLKKAECRKHENLFSMSLLTLNRVLFSNLDDSLILKVRYNQALIYYLKENYLLAENKLIQLKYQLNDTALLAQTDFLNILILNEQERWQESKVVFSRYLLWKNIALDSLVCYKFLEEKHFFKNEKFAKRISYLLPGSGQLYAGKTFQAITSVLLQAASALYFVDSFFAALLSGNGTCFLCVNAARWYGRRSYGPFFHFDSKYYFALFLSS